MTAAPIACRCCGLACRPRRAGSPHGVLHVGLPTAFPHGSVPLGLEREGCGPTIEAEVEELQGCKGGLVQLEFCASKGRYVAAVLRLTVPHSLPQGQPGSGA